MDNFKAVYRILSALEKAMDLTEFDTTQISADALGVIRTGDPLRGFWQRGERI